MNQALETPPRRRSRQVTLALALSGLACIGTTSCVGTASMEQAGDDVTTLAAQLVESARQRVELGQIRVVVRGITEIRPGQVNPRVAANQPVREDVVGKLLEHELVIALSSRVNVVESELVPRPAAPVPASTLSDLATTYGATHLLVGTYQRSDETVILSVRLIDADSHVIVAAARGRVTLPDRDEEERWGRSWASATTPEEPPVLAPVPEPWTGNPPTAAPVAAAIVPASPPGASAASPGTPAGHSRAPAAERVLPPVWTGAASAPRSAPEPKATSPAVRGPAWHWLSAMERRHPWSSGPKP